MSSESDESGTGRRTVDGDDPFEEETQSMPVSTPTEDDGSAADAATTTFGGGQAPPIPIEEEETVVAPVSDLGDGQDDSAGSEKAGTDTLDSAPAPAPADTVVERVAAPSAADAGPTVVETLPEPDDEPEPEPEPEPETAPEPEPRVTTTGSPVAPSASLHPMLLERVDPSLGRGERLRLDGAHWRVTLGRAEQSDVRLYTASASRDHAVIEGSAEGEWILTPVEGKAVLIDGAPTEEAVVLEVGMNLILGGDHLRCVTEGLDRDQMSAQTAAEGWSDSTGGLAARLREMPRWGWAVFALALLGIVSIVLTVL